jgi:PIN domain nuclease of toxin-antitoxin system
VRLLLDTHAMYWYLEGDPQLSGIAEMLIQDASHEVLISKASYWEIAIKVNIGKSVLNRPFEEFIDLGLNRYGFPLLPILPAHTSRLIGLPFPPNHKDPFDRLIIAEDIPVVTADTMFGSYPVIRLW